MIVLYGNKNENKGDWPTWESGGIKIESQSESEDYRTKLAFIQ